jgi:hypothetical protein
MSFTRQEIEEVMTTLRQIKSSAQVSAIGERRLAPHAFYVTGPASGNIPTDVKSFTITNLGESGSAVVFADVNVTGIAGITIMKAKIETIGYWVEDDQNIIKSNITVTPADGHMVLVQYLRKWA